MFNNAFHQRYQNYFLTATNYLMQLVPLIIYFWILITFIVIRQYSKCGQMLKSLILMYYHDHFHYHYHFCIKLELILSDDPMMVPRWLVTVLQSSTYQWWSGRLALQDECRILPLWFDILTNQHVAEVIRFSHRGEQEIHGANITHFTVICDKPHLGARMLVNHCQQKFDGGIFIFDIFV